jgi:hypothetical protein
MPIISIVNRTDREIRVHGGKARGVDLELLRIEGPTKWESFSVFDPILPKEKRDLMVLAGRRTDISSLPHWPPQGRIDVLVLPWTKAEKEAATARYAGWPKPIAGFLMRKFTAPPERYTVDVPPKPQP